MGNPGRDNQKSLLFSSLSLLPWLLCSLRGLSSPALPLFSSILPISHHFHLFLWTEPHLWGLSEIHQPSFSKITKGRYKWKTAWSGRGRGGKGKSGESSICPCVGYFRISWQKHLKGGRICFAHDFHVLIHYGRKVWWQKHSLTLLTSQWPTRSRAIPKAGPGYTLLQIRPYVPKVPQVPKTAPSTQTHESVGRGTLHTQTMYGFGKDVIKHRD